MASKLRSLPLRKADAAQAPAGLSTWLRLLKAHALLLRQVRRFVPGQLTLPQFDALAQLDRQPEGMTLGVLTRELLVTAGNVTGLVNRLVKLGLVERHPVPHDRRAVRVRLSPKGRQVIERAIPPHRRDVEALLSCFPQRELLKLRELLGRLIKTLEAGKPPALPTGGRLRPRPRRGARAASRAGRS